MWQKLSDIWLVVSALYFRIISSAMGGDYLRSVGDGTHEHETSDANDLNALLPSVYEELRALAASYLSGERPEHTLQPTALVHEAYLRLATNAQVEWKDRAQVLGFGARLMRQILINHAIARTRLKRGGPDAVCISLDGVLDFYAGQELSLAHLDHALRALEEVDVRQAQIVEMRFFGGLTIDEVAEALQISTRTVKREWLLAKIWLKRQLSLEQAGARAAALAGGIGG